MVSTRRSWCKAVSAPLPEDHIVGLLREALQQQLLAVYLFGSHVRGEAGADSDIDLAVLVRGKADPVKLWELGQSLAAQFNRDVDLIDLRAASTVMQYQIITTGRRLWETQSQGSLYESAILSEKTELDTARAGLLSDIRDEGTVYGRPIP